jgi:cytochrome c-type biogenesis protein CcmF
VIPELGHFLLWLALGTAVVVGTLPLIGAQRGRADWMAMARPGAGLLFLLVALSYACLTVSFIDNDFSVLYVAQHSNSALPFMYRVAGVWGGHEGSLLLWVLMLVAWMAAVALFSRHLPLPVVARILSVMALVSIGFFLFTLVTSNPFERLFPAPGDGRDLNPLLQDPGMVIHPPMLYMGYVGFSVAFAFAVATSMPNGRAGLAPGRPPPGSSSRWASPSAAGGPTTNSAGAAGGSGTRWKTPLSCPGWSAPP